MYTMTGDVREPVPEMTPGNNAGKKNKLSEALELASPAGAAQALKKSPFMMKQLGKAITNGVDPQHFSKDDAQRYNESSKSYLDSLTDVAGSGVFGPKVAIAAKAVKAVGNLANELKSFKHVSSEVESNLTQDMERGAFNHPIPTKKPLSIDEAAGFKAPGG